MRRFDAAAGVCRRLREPSIGECRRIDRSALSNVVKNSVRSWLAECGIRAAWQMSGPDVRLSVVGSTWFLSVSSARMRSCARC